MRDVDLHMLFLLCLQACGVPMCVGVLCGVIHLQGLGNQAVTHTCTSHDAVTGVSSPLSAPRLA